MSITLFRYASLIALTTALAACDDGGGGGSGDSSTSYIDRDSVPQEDVEVREDNAEEVSERSVTTGDTILGDGTVEVGSIGSTPDVKIPSSQSGPTLVGATLGFLDRFGPDSEQEFTTRASDSYTTDCPNGGNITVSYQYDGQDQYASNSVWDAQFNDCRDNNDVLFRGGYEMTFESDYDQDSGTDWTFDYTVTYDNFRASDGGDVIWEFDGDMGLTWASLSSDPKLNGAQSYRWTVSGDDLYMADPDGTHRLRDFDMTYRYPSSFDAYRFSYDYILSSTDLGGTVTLDTEEDFYIPSGASLFSQGSIWIYAGSSVDKNQPHIELYDSSNSSSPVYFRANVDGDSTYEKDNEPSSALDTDLIL
jgi:hypothetical protein